MRGNELAYLSEGEETRAFRGFKWGVLFAALLWIAIFAGGYWLVSK